MLDGAEVVVLSVGVALAVGSSTGGGEGGPGTEAEARRLADEGVALATEAGLQATGAAVTVPGGSTAAAAIVEAAESHDAELIVMTAHGHGRLRTAVLGSVADGVVKRSARPVLLVPAQ